MLHLVCTKEVGLLRRNSLILLLLPSTLLIFPFLHLFVFPPLSLSRFPFVSFMIPSPPFLPAQMHTSYNHTTVHLRGTFH